MKILIIFFILTALNVILSTVKSLITVKGSPLIAALVNAGYYGFYNLVLIYSVADFSIYWKMAITFICNLIGVWLVKRLEQKARKDKLWEIRATVPKKYFSAVHYDLRDIPHSYVDIEKYVIFNFYCATQKESKKVKDIVNQYEARYFVTESRGEL